jgi:hypothetical protein
MTHAQYAERLVKDLVDAAEGKDNEMMAAFSTIIKGILTRTMEAIQKQEDARCLLNADTARGQSSMPWIYETQFESTTYWTASEFHALLQNALKRIAQDDTITARLTCRL